MFHEIDPSTKRELKQEHLSLAQKILLLTEKLGSEVFADLRADYEMWRGEVRKDAAEKKKLISNVFDFCEKAFGNESQEILILVTEITMNPLTAKFISRYGCKEYFAHNKELLFNERQKEIIRELDDLEDTGYLTNITIQ